MAECPNDLFELVELDPSSRGLLLRVRVSPRAKRSALQGFWGQHLKIALASPPVDGKANEALVEFLARLFAIRKSQVEIVSGLASRTKRVLLRDLLMKDAAEALQIGLTNQ